MHASFGKNSTARIRNSFRSRWTETKHLPGYALGNLHRFLFTYTGVYNNKVKEKAKKRKLLLRRANIKPHFIRTQFLAQKFFQFVQNEGKTNLTLRYGNSLYLGDLPSNSVEGERNPPSRQKELGEHCIVSIVVYYIIDGVKVPSQVYARCLRRKYTSSLTRAVSYFQVLL